MDSQAISALVSALAPIVIPILVNALTWLGNRLLTAVSPNAQAAINPFLPVVAGTLGGLLGVIHGDGVTPGIVSGLAATGLHQAVTQPRKS